MNLERGGTAKVFRESTTGRPATRAARLRGRARSRRGSGFGFRLGLAESVGIRGGGGGFGFRLAADGWRHRPAKTVRIHRLFGFALRNRRIGRRSNLCFLLARPEERGAGQNAD